MNLDGQKATISLGTLSKGDYYVQYKTMVKQLALDSLKDGEEISGVGNTATWKWGSKSENNGTSGAKDPEKVKYQMVQKSADSDSTNDNIKWTVKLNSGSIKADMSGYKFSDKLSDGQKFKAGTSYVVTDASGKQVATGTVDPNSDELNFTLPASAGKQELTVTYVTAMNDTSSTKPVSNTTQVTPPNDKGVPGKANASYRPTDDRTYVTKRLVDSSTVETDGKASWESVINFSAMDTDTVASKVLFSDRIGKNGGSFEHMKFSNIVLKVVGSDAVLTQGADYTVDGGGYSEFTVRFLDSERMKSLIGQHDVVVTYDTMCSGANATYTNTSTVKIDNVDKGSATDSYVINKDLVPAVSKNSSGEAQWKADYTWPDGTKGAWITDWEVHVNCDEPNTWMHRGAADLKGDDVVVKDTLGDDMTYVAGSSRYWLMGNESEGYKNIGDWPKLQAEPTDSNGMTVFTIPTKDAVNQDGSWRGYIKLTYQTATKQSAVDAGGSKELTNTAEASSGSTSFPAGTGKVTINNKVLDKQAVRATDNSHVTYTIKVNPNAQKLTTSGSLTLTDTMNAGASFTTGTLKVKDASGKEVTEGVSYSLKNQPNDDGSTSTVLTITVPDAQALTITYDVAPQGALNTEVWIKNDVSMQGFSSAKASHGQNWVVQKSNAGTDATSYGITVVKTDETGKEALEGAEFTLYKVDLDKSTPDNIVRSKVDTVGDNPKATDKSGTAKFGDKEHPLDAATLYCYEETKAPAGYKITNTAPTYVMFSGSSNQAKADYTAAFAKARQLGIKPNSGTAYNVFDEKATEPTGSATLNVAKQVNGSDPTADQSFEFSIAGNDDASKAKIPENATATTTGAKVASFGSINFAKEDIGQTYTYTIHETSPAPNDGNVWTMASDVTATVKVGTPTDDAPTVIPVTVEYSNANTDGNAALFNNTWAKPGSASTTLSVHKSVDAAAGANVSADEEFTFELYKADAQGNKTDEKLGDAISVKKDGTAKFGELTFDADGTYNYVIHETGHDGNGWTPAADVKAQIVVKKSDDGKSFVVDSVTYDGKRADCANFVDKYEAAKASTSATVSVHKDVEGVTDAVRGKEFTFGLYGSDEQGNKAGDAIATCTAKAGETASFGALSYSTADAGKTFTYWIHEEGQDGDGWALDKDTKVTVTVAENADRSLVAAVSYDRKADGADAAEFTNAYAADGSATVMVKKTVNGEAPEQNKQFTFQLKDKAGNVLSEATTTGNAAAQFAPIKYTLADAGKTFSYTVHESTPAAAGYTNAADKAVTVEVSADNGTGKLKTTVAYDGQGEEDQASATMNNTYVAASGEFQLGLVKTVNGGAPLPGESFEFSATSADEGAPALANAATGADGSAAFEAAKLSDKDLGKTYTYTIHEVTDLGDGWAKAADVTAEVKVPAERDAEGKVVPTVTYNGDAKLTAAKVDNSYQAKPALASLSVDKTVNGAKNDAVKNEFTFGLSAVTDGAPMPAAGGDAATVKGASGASFGQISFDKAGEYKYAITETSDLGRGWTNDAAATATVTVGYAQNGRDLVVEGIKYSRATADGSAAQFDNKYSATGTATIAVTKTVNGGTAVKDGEEFEFELLDKDGQKVDGVENVKVKAGKTAEFKALGYTLADAGKTFDYTVHEIAPAAAGWTAANDVNVQVKVTDNGDGTLNCAVSYLGQDKADQAAAAFDNTYAAAPATAAPTVQKTVKTNDGRVWEMKAGQFSFQLKDGAGTVLQTKAVDVNGHVAFDKLSFDKAGRYTYTISEAPVDATKAPNVKRDPTVYSVTYVVDEKNDGTLNARDLEVKSVTVKSSKAVNKPIQGDSADQNLPFVNSETPRTPETPKTPKSPKTPKAPKSGKTPKTGDVTSNTFAVVAGTAGLVLVATTLHRRRRED